MIQKFVLLFFLAHYVESNLISNNDKNKDTTLYLDIAVEMIEKANSDIRKCPTRGPMDCADILRTGNKKSGVYTIWPVNRLTDDKSLDVYCDMETDGGGWTLIQRRGDYGKPIDFFNRDWKSYKEGFGNIKEDFWLGNDNIFVLTNQKLYSGRFDLLDVDFNKAYALYQEFWIDNELNYYTLHIANYSGNAGDAMTAQSNNQKFSTKDKDNDNEKYQHCSQLYTGGWWFHACHNANLNGLYLKGEHESYANGVNWQFYKGFKESLESTEIKIRPKNFNSL